MEPDAKYTIVGIGVALALMALIMTILWMASGLGKEETKKFVIYFRQHSLAGLQIDSPVTMKGIKVGSVSDFRISRDDIQKVKVKIEVRKDTPIRANTEAVITRNLLTGIANIDLTGSTQESPTLEKNGEDKLPVIREGTSGLQAVTDSLPETLHNIQDAIIKISNLFSEENQRNITGILSDVHAITNEIAEHNSEIGEAVDSLAPFLRNIGKDTEGLKKDLAETMKALRKAAESFTLQSARLGEEFNRAARSVTQAGNKLSNPAAILRGPKKEELGPGEDNL